LIKVEDPETGRCKKNQCRSEPHLEENAAENRGICLKHNNCSIVSLGAPEEASRSDPNICKASSKQSLPSTTSDSQTIDNDAVSIGQSWDIAMNTRRGAKIFNRDWGKQQSTILEVGDKRVIA
jgi:hypothetical protein